MIDRKKGEEKIDIPLGRKVWWRERKSTLLPSGKPLFSERSQE